MKHNRYPMLLYTVGLIVTLCLVSCGPIVPDGATGTPVTINMGSCQGLALDEKFFPFHHTATRTLPKDKVFLENQLIVSGNPRLIVQAIAGVTARGIPITMTVELNLGGRSSNSPFSIGLYQIQTDVIETAITFNEVANDLADNNGTVIPPKAEPNLITSQPKLFGTLGAPGSSGVEGSPGSLPAVTSSTRFWDQWAFGDIGGRTDGSYLFVQDVSSGSELIVLDSLSLSGDTGGPATEYFDGQLCVHKLFGGAASPGRVDGHGLFVSSLASAMATESRVHLIQVLEEAADGQSIRGDLFTLLGVLAELYRPHSSDVIGGTQKVAHTVINLSLGFELNPADYPRFIKSMRTLPPDPGGTSLPKQEPFVPFLVDLVIRDFVDTPGKNELPVMSLDLLFGALERAGYTIVGAAGNMALGEPQAPSSYSTVIGVEAVGTDGNLACFSNEGDVSAPGGNGMAARNSGHPCEVDLSRLCNRNLCDYALIGHYAGEPADPANNTRYGFWAGTSFAAPLVSGLAARIIDTAQQQGIDLIPSQVRSAVYCTATGTATSVTPDPTPPASWSGSVGLISADPAIIEHCIHLVQ